MGTPQRNIITDDRFVFPNPVGGDAETRGEDDEVDQLTDADRTRAIQALVTAMIRFFPKRLKGQKAVEMGRLILLFQEIAGKMVRAKTVEQLHDAEQMLEAVPPRI